MTVYPFIEAEKAQRHNVKRACELLKVSRSAFYTHRAGPSPRARQDAELTAQIEQVHDASAGTYGAPRGWTDRRHATTLTEPPHTHHRRHAARYAGFLTR